MRVRTVVAALVVAIVAVTLGTVLSTVHADKKSNEKVTICHRTNSVVNPYVQETVDKSAVDGQGNNDHTHHTGPVATSQAVAQDLKDNKTKWGDIIPPYDNYPGYNWTNDGQAIYNNGCEYVVQPGTPDMSYDVSCVFVNNVQVVRVTVSNGANATATGTLTVNKVDVTVDPGDSKYLDFADGSKIVIKDNGTRVYRAKVNCEESEPMPNTTYNLVCNAQTHDATITFDNTGNTDSNVSVNQDAFAVAAGTSEQRVVNTGTDGLQIVITIDGNEVFNQMVHCINGGGHLSGGSTPTSTKSLPDTSVGSDALVAASIAGSTALAVVLSVIRRSVLATRL